MKSVTINKFRIQTQTLGAFANEINYLQKARHALSASQSILIDIIALICTSEKKMHNFRSFRRLAAMANFELSLILKKLKAVQDL